MSYQNPVIPGFYPDPSVCRVGEDYYLVNSSFAYYPGVPIFHSKDLVNWRQIGHCLTRKSQLPLADDAGNASGIYAPTLRYHNGRFYMITTNVGNGGHFYVWTEDPAGEWSDPIYVVHEGIDPDLFFDDDGKVYFSSTGAVQSKGIYQFEIDVETGKRLTEPQLIWLGTGGAFPEGPHIYKINEMYYLLCAEGGTEYGHMVTIARGTTPYGPFEADPNNPILSHRSLHHPIHATGHADLIEAHDGSWWAVFLGIRPVGYPYQHHMGRETFLTPVVWTEDGWPIIGNNGVVDLVMDVETLPLHPWTSVPDVDHFNEQDLSMQWNHMRGMSNNQWSLSDRAGWLTLYGSGASLDDKGRISFVARRQTKFSFKASAYLDFTPANDNEEAGLTVFMDDRHHYEIVVKNINDQKAVMLRKRVGSLCVVEGVTICEAGAMTLTIEGEAEQYQFSVQFESGSSIKLGSGETAYVSTEVAGGFTGVYIGMFASGNGRKSDSPAAFDWFAYQ